MAARNHPLAAKAIFHSDRGSNYTNTLSGKPGADHTDALRDTLLGNPWMPPAQLNGVALASLAHHYVMYVTMGIALCLATALSEFAYSDKARPLPAQLKPRPEKSRAKACANLCIGSHSPGSRYASRLVVTPWAR